MIVFFLRNIYSQCIEKSSACLSVKRCHNELLPIKCYFIFVKSVFISEVFNCVLQFESTQDEIVKNDSFIFGSIAINQSVYDLVGHSVPDLIQSLFQFISVN